MIFAAIAAVLLGVVVGTWIAIVAVQRDLEAAPDGTSRLDQAPRPPAPRELHLANCNPRTVDMLPVLCGATA